MIDKKNEFSHNSIDHLSIAKTEKRKIPLETILYGVIVLALLGVAYCNHAKKESESAKAIDYSFKVSTSTPNSSYSGKYVK